MGLKLDEIEADELASTELKSDQNGIETDKMIDAVPEEYFS